MHQIRILEVSFDLVLQPYQLTKFRGAIANKAGLEHEMFHNHDNKKGGTINRYPLIQYKLDTHNGQMRPMLLCLEKGIEESHHFFSQSDLSIFLDGKTHSLRISRMNVNKHFLKVDKHTSTYRLHKWQALNTDSYREYREIEDSQKKVEFLEKRLMNHIISFLSGVDCRLENKFELKIVNVREPQWIGYKKIKILAFTVDFEANISLPNFIGLGKGSSLGLGVLRMCPKEEVLPKQ